MVRGMHRYQHANLSFLVIGCLLLASQVLAAETNAFTRLDPASFLGLSRTELLGSLQARGVKWSQATDRQDPASDLHKIMVKDAGFDVLCIAGRVVEVNLFGPSEKNTVFQGVMPKALTWSDTLSRIKKVMGKPVHEEDVPANDAYYVGYETKGQRVILVMTRIVPRKLRNIRIQAIPAGAEGADLDNR